MQKATRAGYYVYVYLDEQSTPYYVGKGKRYRAYGPHGLVPTPTDKARILIVDHGMSEEDAFGFERYLIALLGRKLDGKGPLLNVRHGGQGGGYNQLLSFAPKGEFDKRRIDDKLFRKAGVNRCDYDCGKLIYKKGLCQDHYLMERHYA